MSALRTTKENSLSGSSNKSAQILELAKSSSAMEGKKSPQSAASVTQTIFPLSIGHLPALSEDMLADKQPVQRLSGRTHPETNQGVKSRGQNRDRADMKQVANTK